jgi:DMSO/TMAO reductase YedYZ molybdopterin-dependent catalytic subunit
MTILTRRALVGGLGAGAAGLLSGCDKLTGNERFRKTLFSANSIHEGLQRALTNRNALAREFRPDQISPIFRANGTTAPTGPDYAAHVTNNFADWRLVVDGLVARPLSLSIDQIGSMPGRAQITRHDCVEGWSAIGKWHGTPLHLILAAAGLRTSAQYLVFHCADVRGTHRYYESIDLIDAFHPQTMIAWGLNGRRLDVAHGAPLRLRVERHLGYKQAKYVERIEAVNDLSGIYRGKGGYWEDVAGYEWYAGI